MRTEDDVKKEQDEVRAILKQNILDAQQHLISQHLFLKYRKGLDKFVWTSQRKKDNILQAVTAYLDEFQAHMQLPVLHLWGASGTGKTHLAGAVSAYLILNKWVRNGSEPGSLIRIASFAYVDWGLYMQSVLEENPLEIDWEADLLVFEGLDDLPPIPRSGDTFRIDRAFTLLKSRLEITKLPTIITTRHVPIDLVRYLTTNAQGEEVGHSRESSQNLVGLIAGATLARGQTGTVSFKIAAIQKPGFQGTIKQMLEKQNNFWPETNRAGLPTLF